MLGTGIPCETHLSISNPSSKKVLAEIISVENWANLSVIASLYNKFLLSIHNKIIQLIFVCQTNHAGTKNYGKNPFDDI